MLAADLIRHFADREQLPVDVNDVLAALKEHGVEDNIEFVGVDLDPDILQGLIKVFHVRHTVYGEPERYANIYYHRGHSIDWQRLICCKELIHLLDPEHAHTKTAEEIAVLAEKIGLPPEMQDPLADGIAANLDRMAEFRAAAVLIPWAARELLMQPYKEGRITAADIARLADVPRKYVGFVMHDMWGAVFSRLSEA